jgi:orotate phosphoribosyltransferase
MPVIIKTINDFANRIGRPQVPKDKIGPFVEGSDLVPRRLFRSGMSVAHEFVEFMMEMGALRFGEFTTKAGRLSPYFFDAGLFNDGDSIARLAQFYAKRTMKALSKEGLEFDMLYGPAYKGIPLVTALSVVMFGLGINLPIAYNRKERKDHGEGGAIIGAPLEGRVLIVDDVISAGTSVRESVEIIRNAGAVPAGVLIALDRQERGMGELSATQEVTNMFGIPVLAASTLSDLIWVLNDMIEHDEQMDDRDQFVMGLHLEKILAYKEQYGVDS